MFYCFVPCPWSCLGSRHVNLDVFNNNNNNNQCSVRTVCTRSAVYRCIMQLKPRQTETRKLNYRKDDRAMRPIYECPENFWSPWLYNSMCPVHAHGNFSWNFYWASLPIDALFMVDIRHPISSIESGRAISTHDVTRLWPLKRDQFITVHAVVLTTFKVIRQRATKLLKFAN